MRSKFDIACNKALNSFPDTGLHKLENIRSAISPYRAVDNVIRELLDKGFVKSVYLDTYTLTDLGLENMDWYEKRMEQMEKELFIQKVAEIRSWVNTAISIAAFVISIIALCC